ALTYIFLIDDSITIYGYDEYGDYNNYTYDNVTGNGEVAAFQTHTTCFPEVSCVFYLVVNLLIFLFGVLGNGLVIWIAGLKMKRTVSTTWYLSLAMSDFILCLFLPFNTFNSFVLFINMFSSIFILAVISVDRCVLVVFAVWAQNNHTNGKSFVVVFLAWVSSVALSLPSAVFRDVKTHLGRSLCYNNYSGQLSHKTIAVSRFIGGFEMPFLIIFFCYSTIIVQLRTSQMMRKSSKPLRVMTALIAAFIISWLPYHVFILLELNHQNYNQDVIRAGLIMGTTVATANSLINPALYVFMGNDFQQKFKSSMLSKIENVIREEGGTTSSCRTSTFL
uniref:G-protein coupled receptors family 1 profile domain-containing protein n=1 Tax=Esox lucius TaxID=8010 RepID=A0A3P8Y5P1_ESOLU